MGARNNANRTGRKEKESSWIIQAIAGTWSNSAVSCDRYRIVRTLGNDKSIYVGYKPTPGIFKKIHPRNDLMEPRIPAVPPNCLSCFFCFFFFFFSFISVMPFMVEYNHQLRPGIKEHYWPQLCYSRHLRLPFLLAVLTSSLWTTTNGFKRSACHPSSRSTFHSLSFYRNLLGLVHRSLFIGYLYRGILYFFWQDINLKSVLEKIRF